MRALLHTLLFWLALAALPLQGFAAVTAPLACAARHAAMAAPAAAMPDHAMAHGHAAMDHAHAGHASDDPPPAKQPAPLGHCAACGLATVAMAPWPPTPPAPATSARFRPVDHRGAAGVVPRGLDRPPKHRLA